MGKYRVTPAGYTAGCGEDSSTITYLLDPIHGCISCLRAVRVMCFSQDRGVPNGNRGWLKNCICFHHTNAWKVRLIPSGRISKCVSRLCTHLLARDMLWQQALQLLGLPLLAKEARLITVCVLDRSLPVAEGNEAVKRWKMSYKDNEDSN